MMYVILTKSNFNCKVLPSWQLGNLLIVAVSWKLWQIGIGWVYFLPVFRLMLLYDELDLECGELAMWQVGRRPHWINTMKVLQSGTCWVSAVQCFAGILCWCPAAKCLWSALSPFSWLFYLHENVTAWMQRRKTSYGTCFISCLHILVHSLINGHTKNVMLRTGNWCMYSNQYKNHNRCQNQIGVSVSVRDLSKPSGGYN